MPIQNVPFNYTSSHGNMPHAIAASTSRRATSGMGIIATPYFPYDVNSVWNRNQLGALDFSDPTTLVITGVIAYLVFTKFALIRKMGI
jgi:hypothetical protein